MAAKRMSGFEEWFLKIQFSGRMRIRLYRKLVSYIKNGVSVPSALENIWRHSSNDGKKPKEVLAVVVNAWLKELKNGKSLGDAVKGWVPDTDRMVIEAGSASGDLATALDNACFIYEGTRKIRTAVLGGVAYPIVLVLVAIGFLIIFGTQVVPNFELVLPRAKWTGEAAQMGLLADFVQVGLAPAIGALIFFVIAMIWSFPRWTGRLRTRVDRLPPYSIYRLVVGAGFLLSLSALVRAGVKTTDVLRLLDRGAKPWYHERIFKTLSYLNNGQNIGDALHMTKFGFPDPETVSDLRAYAVLEGFDEMLTKIGRENLDDTVSKIETQSAIFRNAGIVLLGIVFAWLFMGIFAIQQQITSSL